MPAFSHQTRSLWLLIKSNFSPKKKRNKGCRPGRGRGGVTMGRKPIATFWHHCLNVIYMLTLSPFLFNHSSSLIAVCFCIIRRSSFFIVQVKYISLSFHSACLLEWVRVGGRKGLPYRGRKEEKGHCSSLLNQTFFFFSIQDNQQRLLMIFNIFHLALFFAPFYAINYFSLKKIFFES